MLKTTLGLFLGCFLGAILLTYIFSDRLIFYPPQSSYRDNSRIIKLTTKSGAIISAVYLPNPQAKYTILVSHGNAEDLGFLYPWLKLFESKGFSVFAYDYDGYGTSTGSPSEENAYQDIDAAYQYLTQQLKISPRNIILYGRSLGAAVAIDLAARKKVAGLIVESPFISAFRVVTVVSLLPFDKFNNLAKIKNIYIPILFIHGTNDSIVPFWHGQKLFAAANEPKQAFWIDNAEHNNVVAVAGEKYWQAIMQFVQTLTY